MPIQTAAWSEGALGRLGSASGTLHVSVWGQTQFYGHLLRGKCKSWREGEEEEEEEAVPLPRERWSGVNYGARFLGTRNV